MTYQEVLKKLGWKQGAQEYGFQINQHSDAKNNPEAGSISWNGDRIVAIYQHATQAIEEHLRLEWKVDPNGCALGNGFTKNGAPVPEDDAVREFSARIERLDAHGFRASSSQSPGCRRKSL